MKKPSLKDAGNKGLYRYLEHFAQDKYIQQGHNDVQNSGATIVGSTTSQAEAAQAKAMTDQMQASEEKDEASPSKSNDSTKQGDPKTSSGNPIVEGPLKEDGSF